MFDISRYDCTQFDSYSPTRHVHLNAFIKRITADVDSKAVLYPDNPIRILWIDTKFRVVFDG